jgi:hypothetical protein
MKTIAIMQPYLFPHLAYFQLIKAADVFVLYDDVQYIKRGWINRNRILLQRKPHYITFPVRKCSREATIADYFFANGIEKEKKKVLMTLHHAYSKSPYFETVYPILKGIIDQEETNVALFVEHTIKSLLDLLGIDIRLLRSSELGVDKYLKRKDRLIAIVKALGGQTYVNPIGGIDLYSSQDFADNGIKIRFLKETTEQYAQFTDEFKSSLSIIDVIMFNSIGETKKRLTQFKLIEKDSGESPWT